MSLNFDIQEIIEGDKSVLKYSINGKFVSKDVFYSMKEEQNDISKKQFNKIPKQTQDLNLEEYTDDYNECECEGQGICFNCAIRDLIKEIKECDDNEAIELILEFIDGVEQDSFEAGFEEGFILGMKNICRNLSEQINPIIYGNIEVNFRENENSGNRMDEWEDD